MLVGLMFFGLLCGVHGANAAETGLDHMVIEIPLSGGEQLCLDDTIAGSGANYKFQAVEESDLSTEKLEVAIVIPNQAEKRRAVTTTVLEVPVEHGNFGEKYSVCLINNQVKTSKARIKLTQELVPVESGPEKIGSEYLHPLAQLIKGAQTVATSLVLEFDNSDKLENERKARDEWLRDTISTLATFTVIGLIAVAGWQLVLLNKFFRSKKLI